MGKDSTVITVISKLQPSSESRDACLVTINGLDLGKRFALAQASTLIGRSSKVDIQIDEDSISRNHALLVNDGNCVVVRDLGSTNGTYVNDVQIGEHSLKDGDQIRVGRTIFKFLTGSNIEAAYHEEIYRLTTIDSLTQAYNKRYFLECLDREMSRSLRYLRKLALIMIDIDFFKKVNDTYGHLTGDFVLKQLAFRIHGSIRRDDVFARYGGEEFCLLLPELGKEEATQLAEKLRLLVAGDLFSFDQVNIPVTISAGVVDLDEYKNRLLEQGVDLERSPPQAEVLIKIADDRLYTAKRNGRNCVIDY